MKTVVITGSTRGLGFGMAEEFLRRGHQVVVSGRSSVSLAHAITELASRNDIGHVLGEVCDVSLPDQVQALWDAAVNRFGRVDIWINNAGISHPRGSFQLQTVERIEAVVRANLLGAMYGSRVAAQGMLAQGGGFLYNMEGPRIDKPAAPGFSLYGSTKVGLSYLTQGLVHDLKDTPVRVGFLRPGMVMTDLLLDGFSPAELQQAQRRINLLADTVETVAPFLVERILANERHGARIAWLTQRKIFWRRLRAPFVQRRVLGEL
jgi:NAD(P)-dependent dehydrogenase (short-subunit alcohol dehydrogenase family)